MGYNPPSASVHGDSPGKNTGVGYHDLHQGIQTVSFMSPALAGGLFTTSATWEAHSSYHCSNSISYHLRIYTYKTAFLCIYLLTCDCGTPKIAEWNATTYEICCIYTSHCKHSEGCLHGGVMWFGALQDIASGVAETLAQ